MMLLKCCTQYVNKFGKLISGHKTGRSQFSFQSPNRAMPKNVQTTVQLHLFPMLAKVKMKVAQSCPIFATPQTIKSMKFSRTDYWNGSCSLLQGVFPTQGSNPGLLRCRQILYQLSYQGSLHASKIMLKILQTRLQQYMNHKIPDVQAGFRKGRRARE